MIPTLFLGLSYFNILMMVGSRFIGCCCPGFFTSYVLMRGKPKLKLFCTDIPDVVVM